MSIPAHTRTLQVPTPRRSQMVEITSQVRDLVRERGTVVGHVIVYVPHTTAGVTIQENADPDVQHDLLAKLERLIPHEETYYRHAEGNSDSHLKASMMGSSQTTLIDSGRLMLGRWQGIYLCEFDGPRQREVIVRIYDAGGS